VAFPRFSSLSNVAESGNAVSGWIYTRTGAGDYTTTYAGGSDTSLPASTNGSFIFVYASGIPNAGVDTNNTANSSNNWLLGCYANALGAPYFFVVGGTFDVAADATVNAAIGDWIRYTRTGSTLVVDVSQNSGASWTTIRTSTGFSTAQLYPKLNFNGAASIGPVMATQDVLRVRPRAMDVELVDSPQRRRALSLAALGEGRTPLGRRARPVPDEPAGAEPARRRPLALAALGEGTIPLRRRARTVSDETAIVDLVRRAALPLAALGPAAPSSPFLGRCRRAVADEPAGVELLLRRGLPVAALGSGGGGGGGGTPNARKRIDRQRGREMRGRG
jgi:hypothetical protein